MSIALKLIEPITLENSRYVRKIISKLLQESEAFVTFTKKDGTERVLRCTTNVDLIPLEKLSKDEHDAPIDNSPNAQIRVFETDLGEWRSFILKNLIKIELLP